jgi:DNA-binding GntR family transcriptional regulator
LAPKPDLEQEFRNSRITVRRALALLKRRGIGFSQSGIGTVVRSAGPDSKSLTSPALSAI